ncbi:MAG: dihydrofolate reductase family protein [Candidatus Microgenomates bacterium]|jgi:dihydrofolate reductase
MKITLYMAVSIDGFIAKKDGDSDWVSPVDSVNFEHKIKEKGCIFVGRRTFDQYQGDLYPVKGVTNIVLTSDLSLKSQNDNVIYVQSPSEAVKLAQGRGHNEALLIGGGTTNGLFIKENLIDEVFLSVHPLILGNGIKLFGGVETDLKLRFIDQKELGEGLTQLHYSVVK